MKKILPIVIFALAAGALQAEKLELRGGFLGGLTLPMGDIKGKAGYGTNNNLGYNIGGHLDFILDRNNEIRAHLTYTDFPWGSEWVGYDYRDVEINSPNAGSYYDSYVKRSFTSLQLGADWLYHFDNIDQGVYVLLGLATTRLESKWKEDRDYVPYWWVNPYPAYEHIYLDGSARQTKLSFRAGVGYNFTPNFGLEAVYNHTSVNDGYVRYSDSNQGDLYDWANGYGFSKAQWINVSANFRFGK